MHNQNCGNMAVNNFVPGMSVQNMYDALDSGSLSDWSDSSKTAFMNYLNAENANQHELEMWRLNNEYNTPEKQMERLVKAGFNPAVAYDKVSTGTASSAPGTHKADSTNFHDTSDKLQRINTIMSGISNIMQSVGSAVGVASGIQDMALKHQNNWYDQMRRDVFMHDGFGISNDPSKYAVPYQIAPGIFMDSSQAALFPEFTKGFRSDAYNYDLKSFLAELSESENTRKQGMYEKQMHVSELLNHVFSNLRSSSPDIGSIIRDILEMVLISNLKHY